MRITYEMMHDRCTQLNRIVNGYGGGHMMEKASRREGLLQDQINQDESPYEVIEQLGSWANPDGKGLYILRKGPWKVGRLKMPEYKVKCKTKREAYSILTSMVDAALATVITNLQMRNFRKEWEGRTT